MATLSSGQNLSGLIWLSYQIFYFYFVYVHGFIPGWLKTVFPHDKTMRTVTSDERNKSWDKSHPRIRPREGSFRDESHQRIREVEWKSAHEKLLQVQVHGICTTHTGSTAILVLEGHLIFKSSLQKGERVL